MSTAKLLLPLPAPVMESPLEKPSMAPYIPGLVEEYLKSIPSAGPFAFPLAAETEVSGFAL